MHEHEQILSNDVMSFVHSLYSSERVRTLEKAEIMGELRKHSFPVEVGYLFGRLPEGAYDEAQLIGALDDLAESDETSGRA